MWLPVTRGGHGSGGTGTAVGSISSRVPGLVIKDRFPCASEESDEEHVDTYRAAGSSSDAGVVWAPQTWVRLRFCAKGRSTARDRLGKR